MRGRTKRSLRVALAVTLGTALTAGAAASPGEHRDGGAARQSTKGGTTVTLITGDRVVVGAGGRITQVRPGEGRERIPVRTERAGGRTYVVPYDAQRLIAAGKLDRRLFDVTELASPEGRRLHGDGVKAIVSYAGPAAGSAKKDVRGARATTVHRTLPAVGAEAVAAESPTGAGDLWDALTRTTRGGALTTTAGIEKVWLDAVVKASLDRTTRQIGAPKAWSRSYDGTGVKIAVLDTGIDTSHPDLAGRVVAERNFSSAPGTGDRRGHGTHVASAAAGTGAASGGTHQGVAPGATLLNGKVLNDHGSGSTSGILAGIDWAVAQGADVINMSLGGDDSPGIDPMEALVNKYTAEKGILFAIAAGNSGSGPSTVDSPGSAAGALTVGAVDDDNAIADFSSRGPRFDGGGVKPDVTAPGVAVTAAAATGTGSATGNPPPGYTNKDGTSMAAPHAAGAAAILKQQHPDWTGSRIKAALTGSADPGPYGVWEQGTGRIDIDRATTQNVVAEPASISLGDQRWPHDDAVPVTEKITYRNTGTTDLTLDVSLAAATGPDGLFTLSTPRLTVPAGGTASLDVTADIRAAADGRYQAIVVAKGADGRTVVRTATTVNREPESYDLTIKAIGRDGRPDPNATAGIGFPAGESPDRAVAVDPATGEGTVRLPKGRYALTGQSYDPVTDDTDLMVRPLLDLKGDTTVVLDARTTRPFRVTVPDPEVREGITDLSYVVRQGASTYEWQSGFHSLNSVRSAHVGPALTGGGTVTHHAFSSWQKPGTDYTTAHKGSGTRFPAGLSKHYRPSDFARVDVGLGASVPGKSSQYMAYGEFAPGLGSSTLVHQRAQSRRTSYLTTAQGIRWTLEHDQLSTPDDWRNPESAHWSAAPEKFRAGKKYRVDLNTAVHGPLVNGTFGVFREGDALQAHLPLFADGRGNAADSTYATARTTLHRGTSLVGRADRPTDAGELFTALPPKKATYTLATSVTRPTSVTRVATRVDASWTFRSQRTSEFSQLPLSIARFTPSVGLDSTAPAGRVQTYPVTVQGPAAGKSLKSLSVSVSYDGGKSWRKAVVKDGRVTVKSPAKGKGIALRATVADRQGNKGSMTIHNAYRGK
ncbi:S8 family peptidase [Streptomyces yaizuensis]|uniref:S8 family serine peptidase n=1 Tax=Streptomyces yaizuensis TaxID=2989713 RepID=A0ABQ5P9T4_9ACTN|nr:S8 family serine peptidase [Streptomyces sp. YSPA8]GLF99330.1 S8 family serine peptidase [Streptomyces sp. YSPA8]